MMVSFYNAVFGIGCYYAVISFALRYPAGLDHGTDSFAFVLLMVAALFFALGENGQKSVRALRAAALLLPALALLWNHALPGILEYALPWGYLVYLSYRTPRELSHYYFKADFLHILWIFALIFMFILFRPERGVAALREATPYIVIFLTAGVSLLQMLRHGAQVQKEGDFARHQGRQTAGFFLFCILLTLGNLLEVLENLLLKRLLLPAGLFLGDRFMALVQYLKEKLFEKKPKESKKGFADYLEWVKKQMEKGEAGSTPVPQPPPEPIEYGEINYILLAVLIAVLAAAVVFIILQSNTKKRVQRNVIMDEREELPPKAGGTRKRRQGYTPQELIRKYYRKFMQIADGTSHKLKVQDTTQEIQEKYVQGRGAQQEKLLPLTQEFTKIYRQIRYRGEKCGFSSGREDDASRSGGGFSGMEEDIGRDAKRMKILLDYLKKM